MKKYFLLFIALLLTHPAFAMDTAAKQAIVVDDDTGTTLFTKSADEKMHPSSMSKLMTVYIVFSRLKEGSLKLTDTLPVSEKAWRLQGSKSFVELGNRIAIDDLLKGIIIQSGNDACMVIAEGLAGSEDGFVAQMNEMAKKLGLTNSHFANPDGLSDPNHLMSARDLATLGHHIIHDFPEYYHYFSEKDFVYHGIKQGNRNLLLYKDELHVDGLKTGHTDEGGYGIIVTSLQNGRRVIVAVNGLTSEKERAEEAERLLAFAFRDFENVTLLHKGDKVDTVPVWFGKGESVGLTVDKDLVLTLPKVGRDKLKFTLSYNQAVPAPVNQGDHIADLTIESPDAPKQVVPLVASESVEKLEGIHRASRAALFYLTGK
jgi:D-alanyl-D-alanine carboxypeptidase (penicillin-binding protein 5/6)